MKELYWRVLWQLFDLRQALFVRAVARWMDEDPVLFVHPNGRSPARWYIARIDATMEDEPHNHVEGRMR